MQQCLSIILLSRIGDGGVAGPQPMSTAVHITWHGALINFGDLLPYLTFDCSPAPPMICRWAPHRSLFILVRSKYFGRLWLERPEFRPAGTHACLTAVGGGAVGLVAAVRTVQVAVAAPGGGEALAAQRALEVVRAAAGAHRPAPVAPSLVTPVMTVLRA